MSRVNEIDLERSLSPQASLERVGQAQRRLTHLRLFTAGLLDADRVGPGLIVLFEGFDASGKGGAIRRLTASLDPRHVRVVPIGPPTELERSHHFLWRFAATIPARGEMTVYDRSWYGRLLVERVDAAIDLDTAKRSGDEIVEFERMLVNDGVTIVKFWLHISSEEQLRRFHEREENPMKRWKLTDDDWRNREKRGAYETALIDMVDWTDHPHARWELIAAEDKHYARATILETLIERWEKDLARRGFTVPESRGNDYLH
ncbi:MAG TPA: UDP-galactose-lipid carrier transferase [Acidimicrobiales bacterium]|nr:UDP-galactose-lipid carrier transferase [Acidimicrobiales bacterium]